MTRHTPLAAAQLFAWDQMRVGDGYAHVQVRPNKYQLPVEFIIDDGSNAEKIFIQCSLSGYGPSERNVPRWGNHVKRLIAKHQVMVATKFNSITNGAVFLWVKKYSQEYHLNLPQRNTLSPFR